MKRVLILHTGGTLGMEGSPLQPGRFSAELLEHVPELELLAEVDVRIVCNLDSSDLGPPQWQALARIISTERADWDGFVIIHGTDTMAYTAAALAMTLRGLDRPVILTGAQRPLTA
ncbi:MAG: asparaginase, partial [Myxococcota bacterium]